MQPPPLDLSNNTPIYSKIRIHVYSFLLRLFLDTLILPLFLWPCADRFTTQIDTVKLGMCRVCVYSPKQRTRGVLKPRGVIVHLHGGGWTIGRPENEAQLCRYLCERLGVVVVAPDYRKAPRYPYPHALEQCYSVLTWISSGGLRLELKKHNIALEIDSTRIGLSGASAGSNLAASLTLLTITRPLPYSTSISALGLLYPVLNLTVPYAEKLSRVDPKHILPPWMSRLFFAAYLPPPRSVSDPFVSPALASPSDLRCFPNTVILTAAYDYLAHEAEDFAGILQGVGVKVAHKRFMEVGHGFDGIPTRNKRQRILNARARDEAWGMMTEVFEEAL